VFEIIQQNCTFHLRVLFCREHSEGRRKIKNWREGYFWVSLLIGRQVAMGQHHIKIFQSLFFSCVSSQFFVFRKEKAGTTHSYRIQTSSHHHYGIILMQKFGTESTGIQRDNIQKNGWEDDTFFFHIQKWKRDSHTLWVFFSFDHVLF